MQKYPNYQDIVLVGGGHAHAIVLQMWAMNPLPGARLTLVSPQVQTAYSGMLPGLVAGHYALDETHIDLARLCRAASARFVQACAHQIDPVSRKVSLLGRPPLEYDLLSLDVGATPARELPGSELAMPIKPIGHFFRFWQKLQEQVQKTHVPLKLGVVGGGAGGCELAMAMAHALGEQVLSGQVEIHLIHAADNIPQDYPALARKLTMRELNRLGVHLHRNWPVTEITEPGVRNDRGELLELDRVLLSTNACAPPWLADSRLTLDEKGFVLVDRKLRAQGRQEIFAAGDVASFSTQPLPKAGVYAVRQGPILFHNLRATLTGQPLKVFRPQKRFLSLLSCGGKRAIVVRNRVAAAGNLLWHWKDHIDRTFMRRFSDLSMPTEEMPAAQPRELLAQRAGISLSGMRCNGCGAKVGSEVLRRALEKLPVQQSDYLLRGVGDDAAVLDLPATQLLVQSSDQLRAPVADPWLFGRIAAQHALSDLFAMHARPVSAQALVTLPTAAAEITQRDLQQLLAGAIFELNRHNCALSGGHTAEGAEMQLGFTVNGLAERDQLLEKSGARAGDCLILSKPLGVGTILAAEGMGEAHGRWVQKALDSMLQSNASAAEIFAQNSANALTDVTGFGLLGHLLEMLSADGLSASLIAERLPLIPGAAFCIERGWLSSLQPQNASAYAFVENPQEWQSLPHWALLTDPQTCGGLLAAIPEGSAESCVDALLQSGCAQASIIGAISHSSRAQSRVRLYRDGDWRQLTARDSEAEQSQV
ncbi:selenide, water dikinase SelD [Microbulbifer sp. 2205BS26-8]|uniref:selenide, water dikinase SelD n=1 Tax=Microbulbifer sp. 2205BS26-8 TaxID=3064386 RepID=UPI00273F436E|nr:selenide, water dikinase SelD [Microbulbifer sp. 2205BS26-8]MDP5208567.1 selenide, water dikinase SelD [Microbulbifer sp. 2205BS26-8]